MLYQLKSINPPSYSKNCSMVTRFFSTLLHVVGAQHVRGFAFLFGHVFFPQPESYSKAQRTEMQDSVLYKELVEPAHWVGLRKCDDLLEYLRVRRTN